MTDIWLAKTPNGSLTPADAESINAIEKFGKGEIIKASIRKARNYENHKRFFAFLNTTFDMQECFDNLEHYRRWLVMKAGRYSTCVAPNGNVMFFADSISFDKMDEDDFQKLFSDCLDVFIKELGKGITEEELLRILEFT